MTLDWIETQVQRIRDLTHDPERAHCAEDALHAAVLQDIARGCQDATAKARAALVTTDIEFPRWCA